MPGYRDRDAFNAIVAALQATGVFADVLFPAPIDNILVGADRSPLAVVVPTQWQETPDTTAGSLVRKVSFTITLVVRAEDPMDRFEALDLASSYASNAIDGSTLGGGCLPALTLLSKGVYDPTPRHPELRLAMDGVFSYPIASASTHDTTP